MVYIVSNVKRFEGVVDGVVVVVVVRLKVIEGCGGGVGMVDLKEWMYIIVVECLGVVVLGWLLGYIKSGSDGGMSK